MAIAIHVLVYIFCLSHMFRSKGIATKEVRSTTRLYGMIITGVYTLESLALSSDGRFITFLEFQNITASVRTSSRSMYVHVKSVHVLYLYNIIIMYTLAAVMVLVENPHLDRYENNCSTSSPELPAIPSCHLPPHKICFCKQSHGIKRLNKKIKD